MENHVIQFQFGGTEVTLETGAIARQATGAVMITMGDTQILATVVGAKSVKPGQSFFPLSVHYQEKTYAAGKIPGGYFKREGRPTEKETLTSRLIDRPIRPLFPDGFMNEVQVVLTVMSASKTHDADIAGMLGASAALAISGIPFNGPLGAARVGFDEDGQYLLNPSFEQLSDSRLDMVVAGTRDAVLMVESEADELTEEQMLGAVMFAHREFQVAVDAIEGFAKAHGKPAWTWEAPAIDEPLAASLKEAYQARIVEAY
ncbi:MAG: polyribonucleotide nucleotidyltransferase, partial [Litorivicinaceae bacterium]